MTQTGRVRLYDNFIATRAQVQSRLQEAGITEAALADWGSHGPVQGTDFGARGLVATELRESASFGGDQAGDQLRDELIMEAGSTSDFGTYLNDKATKRLMAGYAEEESNWRQYARDYSVPDFKPVSFVRLTESEDLLEVPEGGPYVDSQLNEIPGPTVSVKDFGRTFSLTRPAIINDDLNQLRDQPARFGRAYVRTLNKSVAAAWSGNGNAYDGTPTFSVAHKNLHTGVLTPDLVSKMATGLRTQIDDNSNRIGLRPYALVVPPELETEALRIINGTQVAMAVNGTSGLTAGRAPFGYGDQNVIGQIVNRLIVETYMTDPDDFVLIADPVRAPSIGVGFLGGVQTPDIFLKDPGMRNVLGTPDPYSMFYDEITWKVRGTWGTAMLDWRGAQKSVN